MKAARFYTAGDIRIDEVATPAIGSQDDVLVEVAFCGICGTDLHEYLAGPIVTPITAHPLTGATLPQTLGHEFSGRVVEIGSAVRGVRVGDRIAAMPAIFCGRCGAGRHGKSHLCSLFAATGLSADTGGLARHALVKDYQAAVLPDELSDEEGALVEPTAVAGYGLERAGVEGGDTVLITGSSPVGALSALHANGVGAGLVIISEPNQARAERARKLDVGPVLNPADNIEDARVTDRPRIIRMIARGNPPVKQVMTSRIDLEEVVTKGFDALVDPAGDQLKILVGAP